MRIPRREWPLLIRECLDITEVNVGTCHMGRILGEGSDTVMEHAHMHTDFGVLCVKDRRTLRVRNLLIHELAHLHAGQDIHHGDKWRCLVVQFGGHLDACGTQRDWHKRSPRGKHSARCPCLTVAPRVQRKWGSRRHYGHGTDFVRT